MTVCCRCQWRRGVGVKAHPKSFDVVKILEKFLKIGKIRRNLGKIC